ncbi:porin family protein [Chitinophaga niabensis]|nr:porin family protein [Chitinophaga niabensis]
MRIILLSLLIVCTLPVCAQVSIGVTGGYSHATINVSNRTPSPPTDILSPPIPESRYVPKWHAGLMADIHLVKRFYLQPQVLISKKGVKMEGSRSQGILYHENFFKADLTYLEVPVNLLYKVPAGKGKLAVGAGVYCARGLSGKYDERGITVATDGSFRSGHAMTGDIRFEKEAPAQPTGYQVYKKYDRGLNFIAGYEFKNGLLFNVNYSLGLTDVYTYEPETRKNRYFGISAGYQFRLLRR